MSFNIMRSSQCMAVFFNAVFSNTILLHPLNYTSTGKICLSTFRPELFRSFHTESIRFKAGKILGSLVNLSKDVIQLPFMGRRILQSDYFLFCEELSAHCT